MEDLIMPQIFKLGDILFSFGQMRINQQNLFMFILQNIIQEQIQQKCG